FSTGCIITAPTSGNNIAVTYFNGSVLHSGAITAFASLPNLTTAVQNQTIDVPLTFSGMPSGITTINLTLAYDNPRMSFVSVVSPMYMGTITTNAAGSYICLTYTNPSGPAINGQFLVLRFMYNGIGTANISFSSPCQFINGSPVQVGYTNGSVSPAPIANNIAQIGYVTGISGTPVDVPITFSSMPTDIGAVTMSVVFDQTKLTYVKESDNPYNAFVQVKNNVITIAWMSGSPTNINGSFITLMFDYVSDPTPDCGPAAITFGDGCQVASTPSGAIVPTNWLNGGVNLKFKITGTLTYDSDPSPRLPMEGYTIYLKSGANVIATTTTAAGTGFFEFLEPNGTYTLEAAVPVGKIWYGDFDDEYYLLDYLIYGNTFPYDNPLRELAADLDQNGSVDFDDDYFLLERLIYDVKDPLWTAPDYLFENPTVVVSCTDVTKDFMGLCSGNINGANSTP
ncbi:MAG: cohesin domain-containing protein, partial [Bacteroidota bacterium]